MLQNPFGFGLFGNGDERERGEPVRPAPGQTVFLHRIAHHRCSHALSHIHINIFFVILIKAVIVTYHFYKGKQDLSVSSGKNCHKIRKMS